MSIYICICISHKALPSVCSFRNRIHITVPHDMLLLCTVGIIVCMLYKLHVRQNACSVPRKCSSFRNFLALFFLWVKIS